MEHLVGLVPEDQCEVIEGAVSAGADVLDESGPGNWRQRLNRRAVDIDVSDVEKCPLAIIFGGYNEGLRILGLADPGGSSRHGFSYPAGLTRPYGVHDDMWMNGVYATMADAWLREAAQSLTPDH